MKEISCEGSYSYVFGTYREPVAYVAPHETICVYTADCFEGKFTNERQLPKDVRNKWVNPQTGPIFVKGADPGDTLVIHVLDIEPTCQRGWSYITGNLGALVPSDNSPMLNEPLPDKSWFYDIKGDMLVHSKALQFEYDPFIGTIATAPELEAVRSDTPFDQGGNMDVPDVKPGNTLYLPVRVPGAYLFLGDCHARQGQGEIGGSAIEMSAKVTLRIELLKNKLIACPRIESPDAIMCVGNAKPLETATRIALIQLLNWMVELGWDRLDAYQCLTQASEVYLGNLVDPNYSMVAKIKKKYAYRYMHNSPD